MIGMKDVRYGCIKAFLQKYMRDERPVLLAISGGPDSMALCELMQMTNLKLHVAHIDHGLRHESAEEARLLKEKIQLPFHCVRLDPSSASNIEEWARKKRYEALVAIAKEIDAQAIVTAHHRDDLAETVLKRVLEGAQLTRLSGLKPESFVGGIPLWRPLLSLSKAELKAKGFDDPMNHDPKYLRPRMRQTILPNLEQQFGKSIDRSLMRLSKRSSDLQAYLDKRIEPYLQAFQDFAIDLRPFFPLEKVEIIHFLTHLAASLDLILTYAEQETLFGLLESKAPNKHVKAFHCHLGRLSVDKAAIVCYHPD